MTETVERMLPLYEGKMINLHDRSPTTRSWQPSTWPAIRCAVTCGWWPERFGSAITRSFHTVWLAWPRTLKISWLVRRWCQH